ncbi:MAG: peptidase S10 [Acidobacteriota bacterium]|nr:peptidase S10 [Acidobacteriota bacterium]
MYKRAVLVSILLVFALAPMQAQQRPPQAPPPPPPAREQAVPARENGAHRTYEVATEADARISQTSHTIRLNGQDIKYTATAGTLPIRQPNGEIAARMFFVAYTRDDQDVKTRPISFLYNGGPGSSTVFLHMGAFSPVRVEMQGDGMQPAPPYHLVPNEDSLIGSTDLVFIDAISTGYSRTVAGVDPKQFHGVNGDFRAFADFIQAYLDKYNRWPSPKFLIGESYGTIRSAGLSRVLQERGVELNGIVLISSLLTYQTLRPSPQNDIAYIDFVPTYAATAWFHKKLSSDLESGPVKAVVDQARTFAFGEYAQALMKGNTLSTADRQAIAQKLSHLIGISPQYIQEANLRVDPARFRKELLRDERLTVGRLDSRFTGVDRDAAGEREEYDPSDTALTGAYTATFLNYIKNDLKWSSDDIHYAVSGDVRPWSWDEFQNRYMDMTEPLRATMARNPFLKIMVACGYYDMATPLGGAEYNFSHMGWDPTFTSRVTFHYYQSGHMIYVRPAPHKALASDIDHFIDTNKTGTTAQ